MSSELHLRDETGHGNDLLSTNRFAKQKHTSYDNHSDKPQTTPKSQRNMTTPHSDTNPGAQEQTHERHLLPRASELPDPQLPVDPHSLLQEELNNLEAWTIDTLRSSQRSFGRYIAFKLPAILASVGVTVLPALGWPKGNIVFGAIASLCIGIDAAWPGGYSFRAKRRASAQIRQLQHAIRTQWNQELLTKGGDTAALRTAAANILTGLQEERSRIDLLITEAEHAMQSEARQPPSPDSRKPK